MSLIMMVQFVVLMVVICGILIFTLKKTLFDTTKGAVNRLNKETEEVRAKQVELNQKIKEANEELERRKKEAQELASKMTVEAEEAAKVEKEKMIAKARKEGEEIIAKAEARKDDIRKAIEREMDLKAVDITIDILAAVMSTKARGALDEHLTGEFLANLEKIDMSLIGPTVNAAEIVTAVPISDANKQKILNVIKGKLKREVSIQASIDPKVVSGVILKFGSLNLDGSLQVLIRETGIALKEKIERR